MFIVQKSNDLICNPKNSLYPIECKIENLDDLIDAAAYDHSGFKHKSNLRANDRFLSTNVLIADVDNSHTENEDSWYNLALLKDIFGEYEFYVLPSKNHNLDKKKRKSRVKIGDDGTPVVGEDGKGIRESVEVIQKMRPKLHLYFPLSKTFEDGDEVEKLYKNFLKKFPFCDHSIKDLARYIDGNFHNPHRKSDSYHNKNGKKLDLDIEYEIGKKQPKSKWSKKENYVGVQEGTVGRNNTLISKLGHLKTKGWTRNMIMLFAEELNATFVPPIDESELVRCVNYVVKNMTTYEPHEVLRYMEDKYSHITVGGSAFVIEGNDILNYKKYDTVRTELKHLKYKPIGEQNYRESFSDWMESKKTKKYTNAIFEDEDDNGKNRLGLMKYNQWRGWAVKPDGGKNADGFYDLINRIVCKGRKNEQEYFYNWLADIVQNPTNKRGHSTCIALRGGKGIGKGTVAECLKYLFKKENFLKTAQKNDLFDRFNSALLGKVFVFGDEIEWPGDKVAENIFKDLITSNVLRVEKKFADAFQTKNAARFLLSTNSDWSVPVSEGERRFVIFEPSEEEKGNIDFFIDAEQQMKDGGAAKVLYDMLNRDLSNVDWTDQPRNEAFVYQKTKSMNIVELFIENSIESIREGRIHAHRDVLGVLERHSFIQYRDAKQAGYITITREQLFECFLLFFNKMANRTDRNYPLSSTDFHYKFIQILYKNTKGRRNKWNMVKKMIDGQDYYHMTIMFLVRIWNHHLKS